MSYNSVFAIDKKNQLFSHLKFGSDKSSFFSMSSEPDDIISGRILKVRK